MEYKITESLLNKYSRFMKITETIRNSQRFTFLPSLTYLGTNHFAGISERFCDVDPNKETKNSIEWIVQIIYEHFQYHRRVQHHRWWRQDADCELTLMGLESIALAGRDPDMTANTRWGFHIRSFILPTARGGGHDYTAPCIMWRLLLWTIITQ